MARGLLCLAALSGQPPEPGGSRRNARGVDGESARRATIRGFVSQEFFRDQHFFLLPVSRGSRERKSAFMARGLLCLAALSGQPPEPGGSRRKARGVDGESARRATIVSGHYAAYVFCVPDPLSPVKFRLCLFN